MRDIRVVAVAAGCLTSGEREKVIHLCSRIPRQANNKAFDTCNYPSIAKRCLMECAVDFLLMGTKKIVSSSLNGLRGSKKIREML